MSFIIFYAESCLIVLVFSFVYQFKQLELSQGPLYFYSVCFFILIIVIYIYQLHLAYYEGILEYKSTISRMNSVLLSNLYTISQLKLQNQIITYKMIFFRGIDLNNNQKIGLFYNSFQLLIQAFLYLIIITMENFPIAQLIIFTFIAICQIPVLCKAKPFRSQIVTGLIYMLRGVDVVACAFRLSDAFLPESNGANLESMKNWVRVGWTLTALNFLILFLGFLIGVALWVETLIQYRANSAQLASIQIFPQINQSMQSVAPSYSNQIPHETNREQELASVKFIKHASEQNVSLNYSAQSMPEVVRFYPEYDSLILGKFPLSQAQIFTTCSKLAPYFEMTVSSLKILFSIESPATPNFQAATTNSRAFNYSANSVEKRKSLCLTLINDSADEIQVSNIKEKQDSVLLKHDYLFEALEPGTTTKKYKFLDRNSHLKDYLLYIFEGRSDEAITLKFNIPYFGKTNLTGQEYAQIYYILSNPSQPLYKQLISQIFEQDHHTNESRNCYLKFIFRKLNGYVGGSDDFRVWLAKLVGSGEDMEEIVIQILLRENTPKNVIFLSIWQQSSGKPLVNEEFISNTKTVFQCISDDLNIILNS